MEKDQSKDVSMVSGREMIPTDLCILRRIIDGAYV